jgi:CheY-like chemotaxis protein
MLIELLPAHVPHAVPTVLIVDDTRDARDMMARLLRLDGYTCVTAEGGPEALRSVELNHPDIVLLDLMMPGMDGFEVLQRLRSDHRHDDLPIVIFSGIGDPNVVARARQLGAADFVIKGSIDRVLDSLRQNLPPC